MKRYVVAHRGASQEKHENTLDAFALAIQQGVDFIEFDVRRTKDGELVIHHDPTVVGNTISESTYAELSGLAETQGYHVPTLTELLANVGGVIGLDVELKEVGYEIEVMETILAQRPSDSFVVTSFNESSIRRIKDRYGEKIRCGWLLGSKKPSHPIRTRLKELFPFGHARRSGADFLAPHHNLLPFAYASRASRHGYPLWVWTVDQPSIISRCLKSEGIEAIITNRPSRVLALRDCGYSIV